MADALGDFFAKKGKKKVKGTNLNNTSEAKKPEAEKPKSKDADEEGWEDPEVAATTMKVEVAGKLMRNEDKKEEDEGSAPAWGSIKNQKGSHAPQVNEKRFPTLAKSVRVSTNINIDDGSEPKVNISTSKNVFAALENEEDEDAEVKRPKEIKPAMVKKKQGERATVALQRELDKYSGKREKGAPVKKEPKNSDESGNEDSEEEEVEEPAEPVVEVKKKQKAKKADVEEKKPAAIEEEEEAKEEELQEDLKIPADLEACKAKYSTRKKPFPGRQLPRSEREEEKENKPKGQQSAKKRVYKEEVDDKKSKLQVLE